MEKQEESHCIKLSQKDYSMSLNYKLFKKKTVIKEVTKKYGIQCNITVVEWLRKFGIFDC